MDYWLLDIDYCLLDMDYCFLDMDYCSLDIGYRVYFAFNVPFDGGYCFNYAVLSVYDFKFFFTEMEYCFYNKFYLLPF